MADREWKRWERRKILQGTPVQVTGDRERDALIAALLAIECRQGERRGWDQRPQLYTVHLEDADASFLTVRSVPAGQWQQAAPDVTDSLVLSTRNLPDPPASRSARSFADSPDGFAAVVFMAEAYKTSRRGVGDPVRAGDPDVLAAAAAIEIRTVSATDINGNVYTIERERDGEPTVHTETLAELLERAAANAAHPRVPPALARLTEALLKSAS